MYISERREESPKSEHQGTLTCKRVGRRGGKIEPEKETERESTKENQGRMVSQKLMKDKILKINGKYCQMLWTDQVR